MAEVLHGWGAVRKWFAAHGVNIHVRTLQRWRVELGLPVVRNEKIRETLARPDILEVWFAEVILRDIERQLAPPRDIARQKPRRR